ncbi:MAG TPA: hypothetical protein VFC30_05100 [Solirubrobacteraceae bacterium]|nr:hypothetical protein [Solirubrobacteraceae bacterium]
MTRSTAPIRVLSACRRGCQLSGFTAVLLLLAGCGSSSTGKTTQSSTTKASQQSTAPASTPSTVAAPRIVTASSGAVTVTLHAGGSHPKVNQAWPIRFTVSSAGRPARASVSYEYLFGGQVVAHRSHYTFTGHFSDIFKWPSSAVGYPLTFRAVIASEGTRINLDYPVQVTG